MRNVVWRWQLRTRESHGITLRHHYLRVASTVIAETWKRLSLFSFHGSWHWMKMKLFTTRPKFSHWAVRIAIKNENRIASVQLKVTLSATSNWQQGLLCLLLVVRRCKWGWHQYGRTRGFGYNAVENSDEKDCCTITALLFFFTLTIYGMIATSTWRRR